MTEAVRASDTVTGCATDASGPDLELLVAHTSAINIGRVGKSFGEDRRRVPRSGRGPLVPPLRCGFAEQDSCTQFPYRLFS